MTSTSEEPARPGPLRLWPGVLAVALLWLARFGLKAAIPGFEGFRNGMMGGLLFALAFVIWWLFFSRARWFERLGGLALMALGLAAAWGFRHESMGPLWVVGYAIPVLCLAFVVGAAVGRHLSDRGRRAVLAVTILLACGGWLLVRTEGIDGNHVARFALRWAKSPEERLVARAGNEPTPRAAPAATKAPPALSVDSVEHARAVSAETSATSEVPEDPEADAPSVTALETSDWPGFRGANRDGVIPGVRIATDWSTSPPAELWRRPVGPGWSSFAVHGDLVYTQEQRGGDEVVACYEKATGEPVWLHRDGVRFIESNAGPGPRATPTLHDGRVYALGATGIVNVLDAGTGARVWSRDVTSDTQAKVPTWGFSGSPLVSGDIVVVAAAGQLAAYELATGTPRWTGPAGGEAYTSPHPVVLDGTSQILLVNDAGAASVSPIDGTVLWAHPWPGMPIVQPAVTAEGDILMSVSVDDGTRRISVTRGPEGWTVEERWTSRRLKPYFNDLVLHRGHAYGFDGRILACIDLESGERQWKGGRYGSGQLVLLPDQDLLLVLSEEGELALVAAEPDAFTELARFPAIEGKTWNHPVLAGDVLLVRNGQEMAAFRLSLAGS